MRMLMRVQIPVDSGSRAIEDGSLPELIRKTLEGVQAEAAYFTTMDGHRTALIVFDMKASSDMVRIAEPLFTGFDAEIDFMPCMNTDDLKTGMSALK
jgi:hypothetical protein